MSSTHPFQTVREFGGDSMHCAELELDEFAPRYSTREDRNHLSFWLSLSGHTQVFPTRGSPYYSISGASIGTNPPGSVWEGSWRGRQTCLVLDVGPSVMREFTKAQIVFPNKRQLMVVEDDRLKYGIMALHQDLKAPSPAGDLFVGHIVRGVTSHYLKTYCACSETRPPREQKLSARDLQRALELIEAQLDTKPVLDDLAAMLGLNITSFCRRFKNSTGLPPYQYLLHARVERAKQALQRHEQPLSELALSLGFYDQSQFSNTFRRIVGVSPRDYMRAQLSQGSPSANSPPTAGMGA